MRAFTLMPVRRRNHTRRQGGAGVFIGLILLTCAGRVSASPSAPAASPGGPFEFALGTYNNQAFESARARFEDLAHLGQASAQRNLAVMLVKGEGGDRNLPAAYAWLTVAASQGDSQAQALQARAEALLKDSAQLALAHKLAESWTSQFSERAVMQTIEPDYETSDADSEDWKSLRNLTAIERTAPSYPPRLASRGVEGWAQIQFLLPDHGHPRDLRLIASTEPEFARAAADALRHWTFTLRRTGLTRTYSQRFNFSNNRSARHEHMLADVIQHLEEQAHEGDVTAMYRLAWAIESLPTDHASLSDSTSLQWLYSSAVHGLRDAMYDVSQRLRSGRGCKADPTKADRWRSIAAAHGQPDALRDLATQAARTDSPAEAIFYIRGASALGGRPTDTARLAWLLATIDDDTAREGRRALDLINSIEQSYFDEAAWHEIHAAALAETGQWRTAIAAQQSAIKQLNKLGIPTDDATHRLQAYENQHALRLPLDSLPY